MTQLALAARKRKRNPIKVGKHPELLEPGESDVILADWRMASPNDLRKAVSEGVDTGDMLAEMEEYEDGDAPLDELPRKLAQAIVNGLREELDALDETGREKRAEPFIQMMRDHANGTLEYETEPGNDGYNNVVDQFQSDLENISDKKLREAAKQMSELAKDTDDETLNEILKDPGLYDVQRHSGYGMADGFVWGYSIGDVHSQSDGAEYDEKLHAILHGGKYKHHGWGEAGRAQKSGETDISVLKTLQGGYEHVEDYPGLSKADLDYAIKELGDHDPYVSFDTDDFDTSFDISIGKYRDDSMVAVVNQERLDEALGVAPPAVGPENDDVVHTYEGTNESIAGASGRGLYVAKLTLRDLRRESAQLGHCIGNEAQGHPQKLREGKTQVFSIRTEAGKPKFTIEMKKLAPSGTRGVDWIVAEIKGKANRLPGFEPGKETMTKPDDVRLVTDFLTAQGFDPDAIRQVRDIKPGILAMEEAGVSPFEPPPKKKARPHRDPRVQPNPREKEGPYPVSARVMKLANKAYNQPFGGVWGRGD